VSTLNLDPATAFVRSLEGTFYMVREAAEILGVNHRTLRNFNEGDEPDLKPSFIAYLGKVKIYLYTEDDLAKLKEHFDSRRKVFPNDDTASKVTGRPARFTKDDRKERQKLFSKSHYYGKRAGEEESKGNYKKAASYLAKQRQVKKRLKNWPTTESQSESLTKQPSTEIEPGSSSSTAPTFQAPTATTT
jgi:hypothetical protein